MRGATGLCNSPDKQTENDARLLFDDILQKTNFIEKLRSVTREVRDKLSQFDPRKTEKITYPCEYLFTVILLAGMAGFKSKHYDKKSVILSF